MLVISNADLDIYIFGIPLIAMLLIGFFRLDEVFASRKSTPARRRHAVDPTECTGMIGEESSSMLSDPDGRPWEPISRKR